MKLQLVTAFLNSLPIHTSSGDGTNITVRCPYCGDSNKSRDHGHFSIRIDVKPGEPILYQCFRAECDAKGILTAEVLQKLGCNNMATIMELLSYNRTVSKNLDRPFKERKEKKYKLVNPDNKLNQYKLRYINQRLGTDFTAKNIKDLKIQLSLFDFLSLNNIHKLSYSKDFCKLLDNYCIGFLSMYSDYLICRDITPKLITSRRYHMYRTAGIVSMDDIKLYSVPSTINLLSREVSTINVAEGPFSILGAKYNTDIGKDTENSIWLANCGSEYLNSIMHVCKQYGLLDVVINIYSDSEIKMEKYKRLYRAINGRLEVVHFNVYYNTKAEDFGHKKHDISVIQNSIQ